MRGASLAERRVGLLPDAPFVFLEDRVPDDETALPLPTDDAVEAAIASDPLLKDIARQPSRVPDDLSALYDVPADLKSKLRDIEQHAPCGGRFYVLWESGPTKGMPLHMYCAEPFCVESGRCTGPRLVPGPVQYTHVDPMDPLSRRRQITVEEIMAGVELGNERVRRITGVRDDRSKADIAKYIGLAWKRMKASMGGGGWGI